MDTDFKSFQQIWMADFEFGVTPGNNPEVRCLVAREFYSGETIRLWHDELTSKPPFPTGPEALFVAFYASAELGCFLSLGWPMPERVLDLFTEFRNYTNGRYSGKNGLVDAMLYFGELSIDVQEKQDMRQLCPTWWDVHPGGEGSPAGLLRI